MLRRLIERFRGAIRAAAPPRVVLEPGGLAILATDGRRVAVPWAVVDRIVAYKRDNVTTDEVHLAFELRDPPGAVREVSEEWPGFEELFGALEREFGISAGWYMEVMHPAFAPNLRILYERARSSMADG
jgi:hypothetical protein